MQPSRQPSAQVPLIFDFFPPCVVIYYYHYSTFEISMYSLQVNHRTILRGRLVNPRDCQQISLLGSPILSQLDRYLYSIRDV